MKNFVLIGVGGYIAPRHLKAIKDTGNNLLAALDIHDSVGILDSYFPKADFFTEFERFDRHCEKLKRNGTPIHYVSVCSPNYLHDAHCRFGLRIGADVICEKPVVLNPWNIEALMEMEKESEKKIFSVLQLRYHPAVIALKNEIENSNADKKYHVKLKYITPRGKWYQYSWKGDADKSGGIAANIGIHFFDLLLWLYGDVLQNEVQEYSDKDASGHLTLEKADVEWQLSTDEDKLPAAIKNAGQHSFRHLIADDKEVDLGNSFDDLHTVCYKEMINGNGFGLSESIKSIQLLHDIRNKKP